MLAARIGSDLKSSAVRLSCSGALLFFRDLMAKIISSVDGGSRLMLRSEATEEIFFSCVSGCQFNISLKFSTLLTSAPLSSF